VKEPFRTLVVDPPWPYEAVGKSDKFGGYVKQGDHSEYKTMSMERILQLPVKSLGADYILLWTTGPFIFDARDVLQAWGFNPITLLTWVKRTVNGKLAYGAGYWFRGCSEFVVVGKRPGTKSIRTHLRNVFEAPATGHSKKPEMFQALVEQKFPGPYIELFARRQRAGWTCLGNEITGNDITVDIEAAAK
jgi:N6-adenosine-specific RNA methylase IME4